MTTREARIVCVTGTGTDIGKTHVTCALLAAGRARGLDVRGYKPVATGIPGLVCPDAEAHALAAGAAYLPPTFSFTPAISPHAAAREAGATIVIEDIVREAQARSTDHALLVVELAGGAFTPLGQATTNVDLVRALAPDVVILVAPDRLGVLHDIGATLEGLRARSAPEPVLVLSAPASPDASTGSNAAEIAFVGLGSVACVFPREPISGAATQEAGRALLRRCRDCP